jgi:uncharacterized repeat protein (TIGR01451 family)
MEALMRLPMLKYFAVTVFGMLLLSFSMPLAALIVPSDTTPAFIQTSGPLAAIGIGDYRTNIVGDNDDHVLSTFVACTPGEFYRFELFDPAMDIAGNPPIPAPPGDERVLDEVRGVADDTSFELIAPNGVSVTGGPVVYTPGQFDAQWTELATVGPLTGTLGVDCGEYQLLASTGNGSGVVEENNDDNAWRFRVLGVDNLGNVTFQPENGPDNTQGTGNESWVGVLFVSYQHSRIGAQDFYWFSDEGDSDMYMLNFDMDGSNSVTYTSPSGVNITGTVSANAVWNDAAPQQLARPTFGQMVPFDIGAGVLAGDATANPETGLWRASINVAPDNQYSFEVPGKQVFLEPPPIPDVIIAKDNTETVVLSPGSTTYTITITNIGAGAALPIPGPEVVDTLPAGTTFASCQVLPPLVGTCGPNGNLVEFNLQGQAGMPAFLPGTASAPNNQGQLRVTVNIDAGLPDGQQLQNVAAVNYTDIFGNSPAPRQADHVVSVVEALPPPPPPGSVADAPGDGGPPGAQTGGIISKTVTPPFTAPGEEVIWTINITSGQPMNDVLVVDNVPPEMQITSVEATSGSVSFSGQQVTFSQAVMNAGETVTITVRSIIRAATGVPFLLRNRACLTASGVAQQCAAAQIVSATELPSTGEGRSPYLVVLALFLSGGVLGLGLWQIRAKVRTHGAAD